MAAPHDALTSTDAATTSSLGEASGHSTGASEPAFANPVSGPDTAAKLGLTAQEFDMICDRLGRVPNFTELSIFSVMWSEHCSYKNSIKWLKTLPRDSDRMLAKAGEENAGLVDIGDGLACSFKIESHNHPSALEPFQGAATGVGGINRDIFTMGARPIAQLNSLRFGNPDLERSRWHLRGVVRGISHYGNAFGVPTVGGEVYFDDCYNVNPLVNAFSAGIVAHDGVARAIAQGVGNPVYIVGSATGRDGIHGATFASEDITEASAAKLPSVQVGDPFMEKLLLEATLEVIASGAVVGIQDMGAAGIICSTSEMSAKGGVGMRIDLDLVPTREPGMAPFEILLSESQERMLIVVEKGREATVEEIFSRWDLDCARIGEVTEGGVLEFYRQGHCYARVPAHELVLGGGAPQYEREYRQPAYVARQADYHPDQVPQADLGQVARFLLSHPNICSRAWIARQYDSMVGASTLTTNIPADASVVAIGDHDKAIVVTVDCNSRYVRADPERGTAIAVCEAARNIVCAGGTPLAITNCLNFGNPYLPEVYWQFVGAIKGMGEACRALGTPVTGGNVSFYNQSNAKNVPAGVDQAVFPTPTIGMLGLMDGLWRLTTLAFTEGGLHLYLLGHDTGDMSSSEYVYSYHKMTDTPAPHLDIEAEVALHGLIRALVDERLLHAAHDLSDGGLWVALAEGAMAGGHGVIVTLDEANGRLDAQLFGEGQGRAVVAVTGKRADRLKELAGEHGVPLRYLGLTGGEHIEITGQFSILLQEAQRLYDEALPKRLDGDIAAAVAAQTQP